MDVRDLDIDLIDWIKDGTNSDYRYDPESASLQKRE